MMKNTVFKYETDTSSHRSDDYKTFKEAILDTRYKEEWILGMSIYTWLYPGSFFHIGEIVVLDVLHPFIQISKHLLGTHLAKHLDCQ